MILMQVHELFPSSRGLELIWSSVVKIGQSLYREAPGTDPFRPDQKTPVKNFFLAGSYTKKLTDSKSMQSMCQMYAAVSYICLGDPESTSQLDQITSCIYPLGLFGMASRKTFLCVLSMAFLVQIAMGVDYPVGGTAGGWDTNTDLSTWATGQTFVAGDSLTFKYPSSHDVVEVTKADYDTCSGNNPLGSYTGGSTTIKLATAGKRYFICTTPGHCAAGMKLEVNVASTTATTAPAPIAPAPKSIAPSLAPVVAPTTDSTVPDLPIVSTPAPSPVPISGAVESTRWAHIALGLGFGLFLVLTI
ncbi:uclacyanin-3-like protein [Carex littledalei]|uniref:Uclacyanin-3-like protein n=1 Tax=Carex littledalei TaxID=544730 RepID=A0A833V269_9POAL|nr:uclacyanin-3-like protein [Carex littledalei]